ncbi:hypothetical protein TUM4433_31960 [Shewanella schlegeliana]|nr:hypothetical protein TUM4433_31960 [Shewanella schlegeliana]
MVSNVEKRTFLLRDTQNKPLRLKAMIKIIKAHISINRDINKQLGSVDKYEPIDSNIYK